jgi:DNA-binding NarL/FixJ family response regulator
VSHPEIAIVIADDQAMVRGGFRALLNAEPGLTVVGEAADGIEALSLVRTLRPDLVLMDIRMPEVDGLEATRLICADPALSSTKVLVLTTFDLDDYVFGSLRAGASGFLLKGMDPQALIDAVRTVTSGESLLAPRATTRLVEAFLDRDRRGHSSPTPHAELTQREREVLVLVAKGLSNTEIAADLFISPYTVKSHVSNLLGKHQLRDRVQLVVLAYESGLVQPGQ